MIMNNRDRILLMDRSTPGRKAFNFPASDVPKQKLPDKNILRNKISLPEISQLEIIRYFTNLSRLNFSIDSNFYPLGSCTMKYNPKINEEIASFSGFQNIHPLQDPKSAQGAIKLIKLLQEFLGEITGLEGVSLAPLAGAQGEYSGLLIARKFHSSNNNSQKNIAIIPDSAHGTNPASAAMAGFDVMTVKSDSNGNVDLEDLKKIINLSLIHI